MIGNIITSILAFASTNIDDIFLLTLIFGSKRYSFYVILAGQFVGVFILVGASLALALIGKLADPRYLGLLGVLPIYLGVRQVLELLNGRKENSDYSLSHQPDKHGFLSITAVTIANGGDNIGVYVPLISTYTVSEITRLIIIFSVMIVGWCYAAKYLSQHPWLSARLDKYAHLIMPIVLIALGLLILMESRAWTLVA